MCVDGKITREESLSKPGLSGLIRSAEDWCKMLDNSDTDELDLDDYYPEGDTESISEDSSDIRVKPGLDLDLPLGPRYNKPRLQAEKKLST